MAAVVTELTIDGSAATRGAQEYERAMDRAQEAMRRSLGAMAVDANRQRDTIATLNSKLNELAAANDNVARSYGAANDNVRQGSSTLHLSGVEALNTTNHLKAAAVAAYALSPAFRDFANPLIVNTLKAIGPAAVAAGGAVASALSPVLAFAARITLPILGIVEAWKAVVAITDLGADRLKDVADLQEKALKAAGQLKPERKELISTEDVARANELNDRMRAASKLIEERWLPLQRDLVGLGVQYNESWVELNELLAEGVRTIQIYYEFFKALPGFLSRKANDAVRDFLPKPTDKELNDNMRALGLDPGETRTQLHQARDALKKYMADQRLVQQQTLQTSDAGRLFRKEVEAQKKETDAAAGEFERLANSIDRQSAAQEADARTVGLGIREHTRLRAEMRLREAAAQDGMVIDEKAAAKIKAVADRAGEAAQALEKARIAADIKFQKDTFFLGSNDVKVAQQLRGLYPDVATALNSAEGQQLRFIATMKELKDLAANFVTTLIDGLVNGKSAMESLTAATKQLSSALINSVIQNPTQGGALGLLPTAAVTVASIFLGRNEHRKQQQAKDRQEALELFDRQRQIVTQSQLAAIRGGDVNAELQRFDIQAQQERVSEMEAGGKAMVQLEQSIAVRRSAIIQDFADKAAAAEQQAAAAAAAAAAEGARRRQDLSDQLFALLQDQDTLQGKLAVFDLQAQRDRESEIQKGGQAINDLEALQAQQRLDIQRDFNKQAVAATERAEQERLDAINKAAGNVVKYVNDLLAGPESTLSPSQRLAAAQSVFNSQLALAQGGNTDAAAGISEYAENLRKAARDFFGSSSGYQSILNQITTSLLALPVVRQSTDPVVNALRDVLTAVNATTGAVGATTSAVNTNTDKVDVGNVISQDQKALLDTMNQASAAANQLQTTANALLSTANNLQVDIKSLSSTSAGQLELLNNQLSGGTVDISTSTNIPQTLRDRPGVVTTAGSVSNNMITALNKIVINTGRTADNIAALHTDMESVSAGVPQSRIVSANTATNPGVFHSGGWIGGGGDVPITAQAGEYMIRREVAAQNRAALPFLNATGRWPANDNSAIVGELQALRRENAALQMQVARLIAAMGDKLAGELGEQTRQLKSEAKSSAIRGVAA